MHAKFQADDTLTEINESTGIWAWKKQNADGTVTYTQLKGDIVFKDVDFGYDEGKIVLHDINLYGRPGQKIAFVGSTGAGKTTITNLINRFYDIQKGQILYDGHDIKSIERTLCVPLLASCCRIPTCSPAPLWRTSATAA